MIAPSVSVIIRTRNRLIDLKKCIASILELDYPNYNIVIVNDGSKDGTREFLEDNYGKNNKFVIVDIKKSKSTAQLYNIGIKYSSGEIVAYTDDDCTVDKNWLKELVKPYLADKRIVCVSGKTYIGNTEDLFNKTAIVGCNMSFKKDIFDSFLFDPDLKYSHWNDELELIYRLKDYNFEVAHTDKAIVRHFIKPGRHAPNALIGAALNHVYMITKKIPLASYYTFFIDYLILGKQKKLGPGYEEGNYEWGFNMLGKFCCTKKIFFSPIKMLRVYYILMFEIPVKAKIKNYVEKRRLNARQKL